MESRSIFDLNPLLAYAFGKAEAQFVALYPTAPVPFLTCTFRSDEQQTALYNQPFDKKDNNGNGLVDEAAERVTNAKAGQSPHNYRPSFAFDVAFKNKNGTVTYAAKWFDMFAQVMAETPGITWGGNFLSIKDKPHFELTGWELLAKKK